VAAFTIRDEASGDAAAIRAVTLAAFRDMPYSEQTEAAIVDALRAAGALAISLVATEGDAVVGHVAVSPVTIAGTEAPGWYGLGPLSVRPDRQRRGIGTALMRAVVERLRTRGARGCVLVGHPAYYARFGFGDTGGLGYPGVPSGYFRALAFADEVPAGIVAFHPGFSARDP